MQDEFNPKGLLDFVSQIINRQHDSGNDQVAISTDPPTNPLYGSDDDLGFC